MSTYRLPDNWLESLFSHIESDTTEGDRMNVHAWMQTWRVAEGHNVRLEDEPYVRVNHADGTGSVYRREDNGSYTLWRADEGQWGAVGGFPRSLFLGWRDELVPATNPEPDIHLPPME